MLAVPPAGCSVPGQEWLSIISRGGTLAVGLSTVGDEDGDGDGDGDKGWGWGLALGTTTHWRADA